MVTSTTYVVQYLGDDSIYRDESTHNSEAEADAAIRMNILKWQAAQFMGTLPSGANSGRPRYYRTLKRTTVTELLSTVEDDGRSLLERLGES